MKKLISISLFLITSVVFGQGGFRWAINNSAYLTYTDSGSGGATRTSNGVITLNAWNHIAMCRSSLNGVVFLINGATSGSFGIVGAPTTPTQSVSIGAYSYGESPLTGYMSDLRFTKGVVRYSLSGAYTMPTSPFPNA